MRRCARIICIATTGVCLFSGGGFGGKPGFGGGGRGGGGGKYLLKRYLLNLDSILLVMHTESSSRKF